MRSEDLPAEDRFAWWCELTNKDTAPAVVSSPDADDFRATVTLADLGPVQLAAHTFPELRAVRTPALIRRSDPERYVLNLITSNALWVSHHDRDCRLETNGLLLADTSLPAEFQAPPGAGPGGMLALHFPKTALPLRPTELERLLARQLPTDVGMTAILARYVTSVASAVVRGEVGETEATRLGEVTLNLAAATLAAQLDAQDRLTPDTRQQALLSAIDAFIGHNLGDPDLTPTAIAAHHHISRGHLHRLFQQRDLTVAASIRQQRLERCRADLADPRLRQRPIHTVGARWGFRNPADFSRAFRAAYGMPPGEYRQRTLTTDGIADPTCATASVARRPE